MVIEATTTPATEVHPQFLKAIKSLVCYFDSELDSSLKPSISQSHQVPPHSKLTETDISGVKSLGTLPNRNSPSLESPLCAILYVKLRRWWSICRDNDDAKSGFLGEFLEVERRFGDGDFYGEAVEMEEGRLVEDNGRILSPVAAQVEERSSTAAVLCRFPISGICRCGA